MPSQSRATSSLFDFVMSDKGGRRTMEFLEKMEALVPWKEIGDEITPALYEGDFGRPGFPVHVLVKALFLEAWYGLSDPELEEQALDRISFQRFLGVHDRRDIPDETTVCRFRGKLVELNAMQEIFDVVGGIIEEQGIRVRRGTLVDATIIDAPKGRKKDDGTTTRDTEAGFTKKNGRTFHGYKAHVATDPMGRFIRSVVVTSASVHDEKAFDALTEGERTAVFADKAYVSKERKRDFRCRGIFWGVLDRAARGHALSHRQQRRNRQKSSVRAHVEHPFAWMKRAMGFVRTRFRGLAKNTAHILLVASAYNLKRLASVPLPS